jgi:ribosomal protein S12 methylthiotransferase
MKIGLISLGCPKNLVDSEVMLGLARDAGHDITHDAASADVLVVNTCAFIDSAKRESIDAILEMAGHKKSGACRRLVVTGCLAERYRDELKREIPEIDAILGTGEVPEIVHAIDGRASTTAPLIFSRRIDSAGVPSSNTQSDIALPSSSCAGAPNPNSRKAPTYIYDAGTPRLQTTPSHYAYIKIAEGCDYKCAFCIIPTLRGPYRSRPAESIVDEARALADRGVKELLLVSQDTTFYGNDRHEHGALGRLLRNLDAIDGLAWIRLLYLYPTTIDDRALAAIADCDKICKYIDLPLQHASDPVLKRMKRPGTRRTYDALLGRIRSRIPHVALRTTFIVGFPGETERDLDQLCGFVEEQAFEHVGVFTYSHEPGTSAHELPDDVPDTIKASRRTRVLATQRRLVRARNRSRVGGRVRVLVDGPHDEHSWVLRGRTVYQAPEIDGSVFLTDCDPSRLDPGDLIDVELVGARDYDLVGRPIAVPA